MYGRTPQTVYATFVNRRRGVDESAFRSWYEDVHRPDSFELGLFQAASRQRSASPSEAEYLTLWEAAYPDTAAALARIRPAAGALRRQGRIEPVLDLVFQQFLQRVPGHGHCEGAGRPVRSVTTLQNDWSRPAVGQGFDDWWARALDGRGAPLAAHSAVYAYAAFDLEDESAGKFLVVLESDQPPDAVARSWRGVGRPSLSAFGAPLPVYPEAGRPDPPERAPGRGDPSPEARSALHVVHWRPESDAEAAPVSDR